jgi:hypothetical protein
MNESLIIKKYPLEIANEAPVLRQRNVIDIQPISSANNPDSQITVSFEARQRKRIAGKTLKSYTNYERSD